MEHYATKRSLLLKKQEQCMKKIRELGSLPSDTFAKYQKTGLKEVCVACVVGGRWVWHGRWVGGCGTCCGVGGCGTGIG